MKPSVKHLGGEKSLSFLLQWNQLEVNLVLNFEPLLQEWKPEPPFVISHFQAIPWGHRGFGYLYVNRDCLTEYYTLYDNEVVIQANPKQITIPETDVDNFSVRPTAVYLFPKSIAYTAEDKIIIKQVFI